VFKQFNRQKTLLSVFYNQRQLNLPLEIPAQRRAFRIYPVTPSSHLPRTMQSAKGIWPRA
jgi:hypothetical protein